MEISRNLIKFVAEHASEDVNSLRLKFSGRSASRAFDGSESLLGVSLDMALIQIEARRKTRKKLSRFVCHEDFLFPSLIAAEQATNESVSAFHEKLLRGCSNLLDMTAGLGIDDMTFAAAGINVTACEIDRDKCDALEHNANVMGVLHKINVVNSDSVEFLRTTRQKFDAIFADPARRDTSGARVHAFSDCQPDVLMALPDILSVAPRLIVKCSPLLDLTMIRQTIDCLSNIYVVCLRGECKEVLVELEKESEFKGVTVVDLASDTTLSTFHSDFSQTEDRSDVKYADRNNPTDYKYLYEPNAGVMKTGDWHTLAIMFPDIEKADTNTHIFFSDTEYMNFPGRRLRILSSPDKKRLKSMKGERINIVARNHPMDAQQIYKKYGLKPGVDSFLYAFRFRGCPEMAICRLISVTRDPE